jgi:hypothetical protein
VAAERSLSQLLASRSFVFVETEISLTVRHSITHEPQLTSKINH